MLMPLLVRTSVGGRTHLPLHSSKSPAERKRSQTIRLRPTLRPRLFLSSTRCPAVGWTIYSPPIHQLRTELPPSKNYRAKWASVNSAQNTLLPVLGTTAG